MNFARADNAITKYKIKEEKGQACVVYIRWDAVKVVLPPLVRSFTALLSFSPALFHPASSFFHSLLFISFASLLPSGTSVYTERGKFRRSALYLRRASTSNGFDALGRNAYLSRAECVCTHACVGRFLTRARARARVFGVHTRARSRSRDARYGGQGGRGRIHAYTHARAARA